MLLGATNVIKFFSQARRMCIALYVLLRPSLHLCPSLHHQLNTALRFRSRAVILKSGKKEVSGGKSKVQKGEGVALVRRVTEDWPEGI